MINPETLLMVAFACGVCVGVFFALCVAAILASQSKEPDSRLVSICCEDIYFCPIVVDTETVNTKENLE